MKIFDGVEVNPAKLSPTWQGVIGAAMLFGNVLMEADKIRCEREAREPAESSAGPTTLADVMAQSGLKIPHLQDALTAFMGGTDEAKEVAAMIIDLPDPAKLLREFTRQYRRQSTPTTAANGPIVTPPPAKAPTAEPAAPTVAATAASSPPKLATFRPEFTPEGLAATEAARKTPAGPPPKLATFRPEFTPEGLAAPTEAAAPRPKLETFRPEFTAEGLAAAEKNAKPATPGVPPNAPAAVNGVAASPAGSGRSLADAMVDRLESLARQRAAHEADLDTRMRCAEAELAMLHEELLSLRTQGERPILFVVPPPDDMVAPTGVSMPEPDEASDAATPKTSEDVAARSEEDPPNDEATPATVPNAVDVDNPPSVEANMSAVEVAVVVEVGDEPQAIASLGDEAVEQTRSTEADADEAVADAEAVSSGGEHAPLPAPSSDADLARALALVDKFGEEQQASYARDSERMRSLERMISTLRGQVEGERSRRSGGGHG